MSWRSFQHSANRSWGGSLIERDHVTRRFLTKRQYLRDLELAGRTTGRFPKKQITLPPTLEHLEAAERHITATRLMTIHNVDLWADDAAGIINLPRSQGL
jgi:hypothetical protein